MQPTGKTPTPKKKTQRILMIRMRDPSDVRASGPQGFRLDMA
jgi:hypothetical protein